VQAGGPPPRAMVQAFLLAGAEGRGRGMSDIVARRVGRAGRAGGRRVEGGERREAGGVRGDDKGCDQGSGSRGPQYWGA
jgi:hypothetical protein